MKKLLLSLMVLASLASCGKNNSVGGAATGAYGSNAITSTVQGASQLGSLIDTYPTSFGTQQIMYYGNYQTYGTLANTGLNIGYRYTKSTTTSAGSNCEKKWGIFWVCSYSSTSSTSGVIESRKVSNNSVDVLTKMNELKDIINRANPLIPIVANYTSYKIVTTDGMQYVIDTRYPLQANPIGIQTPASGTVAATTEYLYNITEN
jgi:hypothetical protein